MIFASSPPSSITTSVCGMKVSTAVLVAMTSWTNSMSSHWAKSKPPEPVMAMVIGVSGTARPPPSPPRRWSRECRHDDAGTPPNSHRPLSSRTASLTVVDPTSMPIRKGAAPSASAVPHDGHAHARALRGPRTPARVCLDLLDARHAHRARINRVVCLSPGRIFAAFLRALSLDAVLFLSVSFSNMT